MLGILAWFIIYDAFTLIMMVLIFGVIISLMFLLIGVYSIYTKLGDKG
jgi:hypothetical protein